jgi:polyisoprenoid-binding protein YceI
MNKVLSILVIAFLIGNCEKPPEAPKAEVKEEKTSSAPVNAGKSSELNLEKSVITWIGTKVTGKHTGTVKLSSGSILVNEGKVVGGKFVLDMSTIEDKDLKGEMKIKLETHLRDTDFFEAKKFPTATFEITGVSAPGADGNVTISGNLDVKSISKSISFPAKIDSDAAKKPVSAKANFNINRRLWNINYNGKANDLISDEVNLDLNLIVL